MIRNNPATPGPDANYLKYTGAEHVLLGGTDGNDILIGSEGDDTLYADGGNDRLEGGSGNDSYFGGDGDDIITDLFGDDIIRSGAGHDAINAGAGVDLIVADAGQDFIVLGADLLDEAFGGVGNDFVLGSKTTEQTLGGEGDDWIEVGAWTGAVGDNFDDQFQADAIKGHDVFHGDGGGRVRAITRPVQGRAKVARLLATGMRRGGPYAGLSLHQTRVNGQPGATVTDADRNLVGVAVLDIADDHIAAVHIIVNPDKLRHVGSQIGGE